MEESEASPYTDDAFGSVSIPKIKLRVPYGFEGPPFTSRNFAASEIYNLLIK